MRCLTPCPFFAPIKVGTETCAECPYRVDKEENAIICGAHETSMGIRPKMEDTSNPEWRGFRYARFHKSKNNLLKAFGRLGDAFEKAAEFATAYFNGEIE